MCCSRLVPAHQLQLSKLLTNSMFTNFPKLIANTKLQIQEAQSYQAGQTRTKSKNQILGHISFKWENLEKCQWEKCFACRERETVTADFCQKLCKQRTMERNLESDEKKTYRPRILSPEKLPFKYEGEIKTFSDTWEPREFISSRPAQQEIAEVLWTEGKWQRSEAHT